MTCEPVSRELVVPLRFQLDPTETWAVQVEVGEGLEPGSTWWVVVLDLPHGDGNGSPRRVRFLTDVPATGAAGKWIPIDYPDYQWAHVHWDPERLVRAKSALTKAEECLAR